jgi:nitrate reductase beta subunit
MRSYQRRVNLGEEPDESIASTVGMSGQQIDDMYRLLAIAKYEDRYVIPTAHAEDAHRLEQLATECSLDYEGGPGMGGGGPTGMDRSARRLASRRRSPWRTSTCCATGRRPTRPPLRRTRAPASIS